MSPPVVVARGLAVRYRAQARPALAGVDFTLAHGQVLGVIGESGSGKSTLASALIGLLPADATVGGTLAIGGAPIAAGAARAWRALRGRVVGHAPQDALASLHPLRTIGDQLAELVALHHGERGALARARIEALAARCELEPALLARHPHALSGGQRQRANIALALAGSPKLLIADELTSALDPLRAAAIVDLLERLARREGLAIVFIAHDLAQVARLADDVLVLRAGEVQEQGPCAAVYAAPRSDYMRSLLALRPGLAPAAPATADRLARPDDHPSAGRQPSHTVTAPAAVAPAPADALAASRDAVVGASETARLDCSGTGAPSAAVLRVEALSVRHGARLALDGVSLSIASGEILGLVGASGSGKSTLARSLLVLDGRPDGRLALDGVALDRARGAALRALRRRIGYVFQDPAASLDPRWTVAALVTEPLRLGGLRDRARLAAAARALLARVALSEDLLDRLPHQLSGGQQQRVAIARAIAAQPRLLICDEAVSALDVSVQAGILELIAGLARTEGLACLFIAHDLEAVRRIAHRVAVLEAGRLVECAPTARLFAAPVHPHTRALLAAADLRRAG